MLQSVAECCRTLQSVVGFIVEKNYIFQIGQRHAAAFRSLTLINAAGRNSRKSARYSIHYVNHSRAFF